MVAVLCPWPALVAALVLGGCSRAEPAPVSPDRLTLELGGQHPSLALAMARLGIPPHTLEVAPRPEPGLQPVPEPGPIPGLAKVPEVEVLEVRLAAGQTVSELASKHLGSARRWQEIADFNGWSERQLRTLPVDTVVKIPLRRGR